MTLSYAAAGDDIADATPESGIVWVYRLWTASHLERAVPTVGCAGEITKGLAIIDHRSCRG